MANGDIVSSPRSTLPPSQILQLALVYLNNAKSQDSDLALVLCHDTEVALKQAKRNAKSNVDQTLREEVANAYIELGMVLHNRGHSNEAQVSYKKAEKLGVDFQTQDHLARHSRSSLIAIPSNIFAKNVRPSITKFKLIEADERLSNTSQLAYCLGLLQSSRSSGVELEPDVQKWLEAIEKDSDEQERLKGMCIDVIRTFKRDEIKDAKVVAEVVCLAPILDKDTFRELLKEFREGIDQSGMLDVHRLEGLAQMVQDAGQGYLQADDLVKLLELLSTRLRGTNQQSPDYMYQLTTAVAHVLDAMADADVTGLDRVSLHEPLLTCLKELKESSDPYLVYQAAYAYQALLCVPDNEPLWKAAMRRTGRVIQGISGLASAACSLDFNKFIEGLGNIQEGLAGASEAVKLINTAYKDVVSLAESGRDFRDCLKEGLSFNQRRAWYSALRGADAMIRNGELTKFRRVVCEGPCQRDPAFQWGVCQRLGEIAANPKWDTDTRRSAIEFLGEIYNNDAEWGQQATVKQWILNILMQLASSSGNALQCTWEYDSMEIRPPNLIQNQLRIDTLN
ncbi:hypothetical protein BGZ65_010710 [Modicella reniformis]|uniref:Arm-like repeat domain-containing protein n=1 Tax=Modicella reniformis TaxID=1440133 RepID=A0A9P6SPK1_9FUNG|nr:hypothetical protein BGZ65_010710 [Modicella reniformis]